MSAPAFTFLVWVGPALALQSFMQLPEPRSVRSGESLTLACRVAEKGGECRWEREGLPVGQYDDKYVWAGARQEGDCSLTILDSSPEYDSGWWSCQVTASNITAADSLISPAVLVSVLSPPSQLYIQESRTGRVFSEGEELTITQGETLQLTCVALGGRPAPSLSWQSALQSSVLHSQTSVLLRAGDTVASLQLEAVVEEGGEVGCVSQHPGQERERRTGLRLVVVRRPVITEISRPARHSLLCQLSREDREDGEVRISWFRLGQSAPLSTSALLDLAPLTPEDIGDYVCLAENSVGRTERVFSFTFDFPVRITELTTGPVTASLGSSLELTCLVEAVPEAEVWWEVEGEKGREVVGRGETLLLPSLTYRQAGLYRCQAANTAGGSERQEVSSEDIRVEVVGGPTVTTAASQTHLRAGRGENIELTAEYCSHPQSSVQWLDGRANILQSSHSEIFSLEPQPEAGPHCYTAKMILLNVETFHNGGYTLRLENEFGTEDHQFKVSLRDDFLNFEVLVAISAGVIFTVIVLMFVVISLCRRHRAGLSRAETSSRDTESETYSRDNSHEELLFNIKHLAGEHRSSDNIYSFPNGGGSLRKSRQDRKVYHDNTYVHINTNSYSYVSYDDVDKQISNIL